MSMRRRAATIAIASVLVGLLAMVLALPRIGPFHAGGVRCVHSLEADPDTPSFGSPREAIAADPYASTEMDLVEHEHEDAVYAGFRNDRSVYWTQRLHDGRWRMMDRTRFARCDRHAFSGRPFAPGEERPLPECEPFDEDEIYQDPTDIDLEGAPTCDAVGVPFSGVISVPAG